MMAYTAIAVANAFIERAHDAHVVDLSPMKLQKLVFFAQSWSLKLLEQPLVEDFFAKWQYGPVVPQLYHATKDYGSQHVAGLISTLEFAEDGGFIQVTPRVYVDDVMCNCIIDNVMSIYGSMTAAYLSRLTHLPGSAWSKTGDEQAVIDNRLLRECIIIEEGRFMSAAQFPFNFDVKRMRCRVNDDFITIPDEVSSVEDMDKWLKEMVG
ncbi:type II toxin-antitoxin system antitoxin SocA domain-containing protein [Serratia fonticola]|uniref:Panacea domain-containing protein n=1 Tax=Serratia fonticola TaxID=47917 RepID=UPI003AB104C8